MKWIEVLEGDVSSLINLDNIRLIQLCGSDIELYEIHCIVSMEPKLMYSKPYIIKSPKDFDAQIKYSLIKAYINYGPTPKVLTIMSE